MTSLRNLTDAKSVGALVGWLPGFVTHRAGLHIHLVSCLRDVTMSTRWLTVSTGMAAHTVRCLSPALDGGDTDDAEDDMSRAYCFGGERRRTRLQ